MLIFNLIFTIFTAIYFSDVIIMLLYVMFNILHVYTYHVHRGGSRGGGLLGLQPPLWKIIYHIYNNVLYKLYD